MEVQNEQLDPSAPVQKLVDPIFAAVSRFSNNPTSPEKVLIIIS